MRKFLLASILCLASCQNARVEQPVAEGESAAVDFDEARRRMVEEQIRSRGVGDETVLAAMAVVPRHEFIPEEYRLYAYEDTPLPIGLEQTISQPYIVALMTELVSPTAGDRVLEVGTGSGYQAAVIAQIVDRVYTIEIIPRLALSAGRLLTRLEIANVEVRIGDGYTGWPKHAPFDGILVTAGATEIPQPLVDQLAPGARMIIPVGETQAVQVLKVVEKLEDGTVETRDIVPVRFVPLRRN